MKLDYIKRRRAMDEERAEKKKWTAPQLIVLVRGRPEEGVLVGCKKVAGPFSGPGMQFGGCGGIVGGCIPRCGIPLGS